MVFSRCVPFSLTGQSPACRQTGRVWLFGGRLRLVVGGRLYATPDAAPNPIAEKVRLFEFAPLNQLLTRVR